jgi:hypothetical protein
MAIEHDQRLSDGIHDGLRQRANVLNPQESLDVGHNHGSFELTHRRANLDARARAG